MSRLCSINPRLIVAANRCDLLVHGIQTNESAPPIQHPEFLGNTTVESVHDIPQEAFEPGNKNGPILMWAAMVANDPQVIRALVARGSDVHEKDIVASGTGADWRCRL